jgi:hypothetical protein
MRRLLACAALALGLATAFAADRKDESEKPKDTPKAAAMRKRLKQKVEEINWKGTRLEEAIEELQDQVKGLSIRMDTAGGVSRNQPVSFTGKNKTVEEVLNGMFAKTDLGYIIISDPRHTYDGSILIRKGKERGYPMKK